MRGDGVTTVIGQRLRDTDDDAPAPDRGPSAALDVTDAALPA
jgi:hypothetical protein